MRAWHRHNLVRWEAFFNVAFAGHLQTLDLWPSAHFLLRIVIPVVEEISHKMRVSSRVHIMRFDNVLCIMVASAKSPTVSNDRAAPAHRVRAESSRDNSLVSLAVVGLEIVVKLHLYEITKRLSSPSISIRVGRFIGCSVSVVSEVGNQIGVAAHVHVVRLHNLGIVLRIFQ